jgi:CheY-like chemotaxis protein
MIKKVFCIDDDPITLMLCSKVMQRVNFAEEIETLQNGEEAINFFDNNVSNANNPSIIPNLIFLDLNMPIMSGWEFLDIYLKKEYHVIFSNTKFIVLSSTIDPNDVEKSKSYPMVIDFLSKPISKTMLEKINSI